MGKGDRLHILATVVWRSLLRFRLGMGKAPLLRRGFLVGLLVGDDEQSRLDHAGEVVAGEDSSCGERLGGVLLGDGLEGDGCGAKGGEVDGLPAAVHGSTITVIPSCGNNRYSGFMGILEDLSDASDKLRQLDQRRKDQQAYRDDLIRSAINAGVGWADISRATRMLPRSLALAIKRTEPK